MTLLFFLLFLHSQRIIWPSLLTTPTIQSTAVMWKRSNWKSSSERWRRICATSQYWASPISSCWRTWIRTPSPTSQGGTSSSSWRKLQAGKRTWGKLKNLWNDFQNLWNDFSLECSSDKQKSMRQKSREMKKQNGISRTDCRDGNWWKMDFLYPHRASEHVTLPSQHHRKSPEYSRDDGAFFLMIARFPKLNF